MDLVTIAIAVSRVEAVVVAAMLEGYGIRVHIGVDGQGSTEYNSLALGGYRLRVSEADWPTASDILRQPAATASESFCTGPRKALVRFLAVWFGLHAAVIVVFIPAIGAPPVTIALMPFAMMIVPVNPQGRADYYLAPPDS